MRILIDGYNLLFQSSLVGTGRGHGWLDRARSRLISLLHAHLDDQLLKRTTVVFDASQTGSTGADFRSERGLSIIFSRQHPEADDLLEELIQQHPSPKSLLVVSSDHRIRKCAKARRAQPISSEGFLHVLPDYCSQARNSVAPTNSQSSDIAKERSDEMTDEQVAFWLREFGQQ